MRDHLTCVACCLSLALACGTPPTSDVDAGNIRSIADAGTSVADATSPPVDAGSVPTDSGLPLVDAGSSPQDTGQQPVDGGSTPDASADAGAQLGLQPNICSIWESQIFSGCANGYCHGGGSAGGFRLDHSSAQALHDSIVNVETAARMYYVVPENDRMSYLINKLDGTQDQLVSGAGDRMPPGGPYLSFQQLEVLRQWINAGASSDCP